MSYEAILIVATLRAIAQLRACRPIPEAQVREICHKARELLIEEGNVVTVTAPVTVLPQYLCEESKADKDRYVVIFMANSMISWSYSE